MTTLSGQEAGPTGCAVLRRANRRRPRRCRLLTRQACARLGGFSAANPRRGQWTSVRWLVSASCASEVAILPQPCEGDPLAKAGCTIDRRTSRFRSLRCRLLIRQACARLANFSHANPRRGQWTSVRWLVSASCASEVAILPQSCEGDPLAQAGCTTNRRASRHRSLRCGALTLRACARLADFSLPTLAGVSGHQAERVLGYRSAGAVTPSGMGGLVIAGCHVGRLPMHPLSGGGDLQDGGRHRNSRLPSCRPRTMRQSK